MATFVMGLLYSPFSVFRVTTRISPWVNINHPSQWPSCGKQWYITQQYNVSNFYIFSTYGTTLCTYLTRQCILQTISSNSVAVNSDTNAICVMQRREFQSPPHALIWHSTVVISSKVNLTSDDTHVIDETSSTSLASQSPPKCGDRSGMNLHSILVSRLALNELDQLFQLSICSKKVGAIVTQQQGWITSTCDEMTQSCNKCFRGQIAHQLKVYSLYI